MENLLEWVLTQSSPLWLDITGMSLFTMILDLILSEINMFNCLLINCLARQGKCASIIGSLVLTGGISCPKEFDSSGIVV